MPTIDQLVAHGSTEWNALRARGEAPTDHVGATFNARSFARADFSDLNLVGSEWADCIIGAVDFRRADLSNAYVHDTRFEECDFRGASFEGATLENVEFIRCRCAAAKGLAQADQTDVSFTDCDLADRDDDNYEPAAHRVPGLVAVNEELEAVVEADLDDPARRLVHADWLQAQGDVRGELVLHHAKDHAGDQRNELLEELLGEAADAVRGGTGSPTVDLKWAHGLIDRCALVDERNAAWVTERLLLRGAARFARAWSWPQMNYTALARCLTTAPGRGAIRSLVFGEDTDPDDRTLRGEGDFTGLWHHLPRLESLAIVGSNVTLGSLDLPELKVFRLETQPAGDDLRASLLAARWPNLEKLSLRGVSAATDVLATTPRLVHFVARRATNPLRLLEGLLEWPRVGQLRTVDLSGSRLGPNAAKLILEHRDRLSGLQTLVVSDTFSETDRRALNLLPFVILK